MAGRVCGVGVWAALGGAGPAVFGVGAGLRRRSAVLGRPLSASGRGLGGALLGLDGLYGRGDDAEPGGDLPDAGRRPDQRGPNVSLGGGR